MKPFISGARALCFVSLAFVGAYASGCATPGQHHLASASLASRGEVVGTQGSTAAARRDSIDDDGFASSGGRSERGIPTPQPAREPRVSLPTPQPPLPERPMPSYSGRSPGSVGRWASW